MTIRRKERKIETETERESESQRERIREGATHKRYSRTHIQIHMD